MTSHRVRIIFTTDYGEQLRTHDLTVPTWIVGSVNNDPVISSLWTTNAGNITKFNAQDLDTLLGTVDEHHPQWRKLEVHGLAHEHAQTALRPYRGSYSSEGADVFVFTKSE